MQQDNPFINIPRYLSTVLYAYTVHSWRVYFINYKPIKTIAKSLVQEFIVDPLAFSRLRAVISNTRTASQRENLLVQLLRNRIRVQKTLIRLVSTRRQEFINSYERYEQIAKNIDYLKESLAIKRQTILAMKTEFSMRKKGIIVTLKNTAMLDKSAACLLRSTWVFLEKWGRLTESKRALENSELLCDTDFPQEALGQKMPDFLVDRVSDSLDHQIADSLVYQISYSDLFLTNINYLLELQDVILYVSNVL